MAAGADGHAVHVPQGLGRDQPQSESVKTELYMDRRALLRRAKGLGEPEQAAVETGSGLDVLDVEVDLGARNVQPSWHPDRLQPAGRRRAIRSLF